MSTDTTPRNSSVFSLRPEDAPSERQKPAEAFSLQPSPVTFRDRLEVGVEAARAWIVPPNVLTTPPEPFSELSSYASRGAWTSSTGVIRRLGVLWLAVVALPAIFCLRMAEWLIQRPSRALLFAVIWQLFIRSGAGEWLSDYVIHPILAAAAWVFLS